MKYLLYSFVFLFLSWLASPCNAQVSPSKKVLVGSGNFKEGDFELYRYAGDGAQNTSSIAGPGFVSTGGSLEEIFTELWPEYTFNIAHSYAKEVFTLRINSKADLDKSTLDQLWGQLNQMSEFTATQSSENLRGHCLKIISQTQLNKSIYTPKGGVLKKDESRKSNLRLEGYSLSELAEKLSQIKQVGRFFFEKNKKLPVYSFRLNASSQDVLRESLTRHGLSFEPCTRTIPVYILK